MTDVSKRSLLQSGGLMGAAALLGCANPVISQSAVKTPFAVPAVFIPIVGSDEMYPVRRVYCGYSGTP